MEVEAAEATHEPEVIPDESAVPDNGEADLIEEPDVQVRPSILGIQKAAVHPLEPQSIYMFANLTQTAEAPVSDLLNCSVQCLERIAHHSLPSSRVVIELCQFNGARWLAG